jgi:molecular chaperone GrpE (heat shock protein)
MATTSDTFQVILAEFKKSLPPKELENFQVTTLADVRESIIRIQRDQEELKRMMNMTRLESFLEAMEQFGKVIEVFVNASNFVAFVWGPMKLILQVRH